MKNNYNKILEAVNKGIQLALDDFDEEQIQNIKSKQVQNRDYTKEYLDLMSETVDLGLPSGTLWCKYNLDVNPNQLTKPEDWYGGYYAWGELNGNKPKYDWPNYKFGKEYNKLTKYCSRSEYGLNRFRDILTQLLSEDDVAYQKKKLYNYKFHIPSKKQYEELKNYTTNYWVNNYDSNKTIHNPEDDGGIKGLNGMVFDGQNGNQLFIPAAGYYNSNNMQIVGYGCNVWTSSLVLGTPSEAYCLYFNLNNIIVYSYNRCSGCSVRPVVNL